MIYQKTLRHSVSCTGVGIHKGIETTLTLKPAEADTGYVFIRTDITDKANTIHGRWDNVTETQLCTVLSNTEGVTISTVEHLLSALAAYGIENAVIEVDGPEIPIMDGSATAFIDLVNQAGIRKLDAPKQFLRLKKTITYTQDDMSVTLRPSYHPTWTMDIDFISPVIGQQSYLFSGDQDDYTREISMARTFGFLHEVEALRKMGLAQGGSLDNAIVIDGDTVMNPDGLRYTNEFVRHKILDAIGDLALAGGSILADYHGVKAGHAMNNKILREVFSDKTAYEWVNSTQLDRIITITAPIRVTYATPPAHLFTNELQNTI